MGWVPGRFTWNRCLQFRSPDEAKRNPGRLRSRNTFPGFRCAPSGLQASCCFTETGGGRFRPVSRETRAALIAASGPADLGGRFDFTAQAVLAVNDTRAPIPSLRGALATKQSRLPPRSDSGFLRSARNDGVDRSLVPSLPAARAVRDLARSSLPVGPILFHVKRQSAQFRFYCAWGCFRENAHRLLPPRFTGNNRLTQFLLPASPPLR
ncbi:hypothetical protein ABIA95_006429 [Bradyrhizobium sp. LA8.1]